MDSLDSVSNCSESSIHSELLQSNTSSLSCLSSSDIFDIKHLIDTRKNCSVPYVSEDFLFLLLEERMQNLTLKQNEKHKNDLYNLQKSIELSFYEKIEKLLKQNSQLEENLHIANKRIERLIENCSKSNTEIGIFELKNEIITLEKSSHDLNLKNSLLQNELNQIKNEKNCISGENKNLKYLNSELNAKLNCIKELKNKITEQYIQIENILQNNVELKQTNNLLINELDFIKKTEIWYKEQLQLNQNQKQTLSNEVNEIKQQFSNQQEKLQQITLEFNKSKNKCEKLELNFIKELMKENSNQHLHRNELQCTNMNDFEIKSNYYEATIRDLTDEVIRVKNFISQQQNSFTLVTKENSELLAKCLLLQKNLEEKEYFIENLKIEINDLNKIIQNENKNELLQLKNDCCNLQIELKAEKEEKEIIENSVRIIRNQLRILKNNYDGLKDDLTKKNKEVIQLEFEKQKLFMDNNWKICELEKINGLKKKIEIFQQNKKMKLDNNKKDLQRKFCDLEEKCTSLKTKSNKLEKKFLIIREELNLSKETDKLEEIKYLKALLQVRELEMKEKQKKYETNYRTLLRKVKEHMKRREFAEKHNKELQELYNNIMDEHNCFKLINKKCEFERTVLEEKIIELNKQNEVLSEKLEVVNSNLQKKTEELTEFHSSNEINQLRNDNFFLKRICNDLKITIKSHSSQNKFLQEKLNKEKEFHSLPVIKNPKYDEDYINKLLEENKIPQKSSFNDIQDCLKVLKGEIMNLQKQIVDKNLE